MTFAGFESRRIATHGAEIHALVGGAGPPVLLLHGYPQSHAMWHAVAPRLRGFALVIPDLRGYGNSIGPAPDSGHQNYSKRAMAGDMVEVMAALGHRRFSVAGHDRGGRVAYRLALDHPDCVVRLAVLDILPTLDVWQHIDERSAMSSYHWLLLAQPAPLPEHLIGCDPDFFFHHILDSWVGDRRRLDADAVEEYLKHFRRPSVIAAACEDYRAGATIDLELDRQDHAVGRRIGCPTLLLWSKQFLGRGASPPTVWERWAERVTDVMLDCGHFLAEEEPEACAKALTEFLDASSSV
jgi:haloacetate dehalogenase